MELVLKEIRFVQYYGIDSSLIEFIAERQKQKDGTITPGSWIKIISEEAMRKMKPDYLFILPWHFSTEFYYREKELLKNGCSSLTITRIINIGII